MLLTMVAAKCERELRNLDVSFVTFPLRVHLRQLNKAKRLQTYLFYGSQSSMSRLWRKEENRHHFFVSHNDHHKPIATFTIAH